MITTYHLEIFGRTYGGFKSCYQYPLTELRALALTLPGAEGPNTLDAGDFAEILDWRVVKETVEYVTPRHGVFTRTDTFKALRGFRNGMSPRRFYRLINA